MSPITYHLLHVVGVLFLFVGIGGIASNDAGSRKKAMMYHGIGLLILLIAGFGLIAKLNLSYTAPWVLVKAGIWLTLGILPVLVKRGVLPPKALIYLAIVLGGAAAWSGYLKDAAW